MEPTARFGRRAAPQSGWRPELPPMPPRPADAPSVAGRRVTHWLKPPEAPRTLDEQVAPDAPKGWPLITGALLLLLALIFWLQNTYAFGVGKGLSPDYASLVAEGAVSRGLVFGEGQWWRLFTASLLHGSIEHIIGNSITLLFIGWYLERLVGHAWFAAAYIIGGLGGAFGALLLDTADVAGVGASGAIMGLFGTAIVCSFHVEAHHNRGRAQYRIARWGLPALIPSDPTGPTLVGYSAHAGGAMAGVLTGFLILMLWPETQTRPRLARGAWALAFAGAVASAIAVCAVVGQYGAYKAQSVALIPQGDLQGAEAEIEARSAMFTLRYPGDPRGHLYRALYWLRQGRGEAGIAELRTGLADRAAFTDEIPASTAPMMRLVLAGVLAEVGRQAEAREAVGDACDYPFPANQFADDIRTLRDQGVCAWKPGPPA